LMFAAMLFASRNVPLFAIVAAPLAAAGLGVRVSTLRAVGLKIRELEPVASIAICLAILLSGVALAIGQRHGPQRLPTRAMASLNDGRPHRLLCENFTWCSIALEDPNLRVFIDGRCDAYPIAIWDAYISTIQARPKWSSDLANYNVDAVVARQGSQLESALAASPAWGRTYRDDSYVVFRRD